MIRYAFLLVAALLTSPALAVDIVEERFSVAVLPGQTAMQDLACPDEQLISGGYAIDAVSDGGMADVSVIASTRGAPGTWRVGLYNASATALTVDLRISIMCD